MRILLDRRLRAARGDAREEARLVRRCAQAREALREPMLRFSAARRKEVERWLLEFETAITTPAAPPASPPPTDLFQPEVAGAPPLFDYRSDLDEAIWSTHHVKGISRWIMEGSRAWKAFTSPGKHPGPGLILVVALDGATRTSRVCALQASHVGGSDLFANPVLIAKTNTHLCLVEFHNVVVFPLDEAGVPDANRAVFLGPEQGLPGIGLRSPDILQDYTISALGALGGEFYLCASRPRHPESNRPLNFGGVYRWCPGETNVTRVASCHSLEPGLLNDCEPYMLFNAAPEAGGDSLWFSLAGGPPVPATGRSGARTLRLTPPGTWEPAAPPPSPAIPWRATKAKDGATFTLERVEDGIPKAVQTFGCDDFAHGDFASVTNGVFWRVARQRPLIYFVPNPVAPAPEPSKR